MKILHRHLLASQLINLILTLVVFTFILLMGNILKDVMVLLMNRSVGVMTIGRFFLLLLPYIISFSMPMALLAATLLVMGRISADQELTACRACGISLLQLVTPLVGVTAALSFVSLYINCSLAPQTRYAFNQAFVGVALENPLALLEEGQFIHDFEGMVLFIGKRDLRHQIIEDVRVMTMQNGEMVRDVHARKGVVFPDPKLLRIRIILYHARIDERDPENPEDLSRRKWNVAAEEYPIDLEMKKLVNERRAVKELHHYTSADLWKQVLELKALGIHPTPILVELHKRLALSMACIAFVLVALPLGIRMQRRESSIGIMISLFLAVLYYLLILVAESFRGNPGLYPEFLIWVPNLMFEAIGIWLLWRQQRI